jgi:protease-4
MLRSRPWKLFTAAAIVMTAAAFPLRAADEKPVTVAHIKLAGDLEESPPSLDPLLGLGGENFKAKLDRIKKAKKDASVQALDLQLDGLAVGWGKVDELTKAIADFRQSGKKVFAQLEAGDIKDYLVALACDEISIPESGWIMLTGVRAEVTFYKEMLEKIGVKADMLQMGEAKSAAEPFTRTKLSDASRKQLEGVIDDFYERGIVERIIKLRAGKNFTAEQVKKLIDEGPYTAKRAFQVGLVDRLAYADTLEDHLKQALKAEEVKVVKNYGQEKAKGLDFSDPFAILKLLAPPKSSSSGSWLPAQPKIALIYAVGPITTGKSSQSLLGGETVGSTTLVEAIRQAENDKSVKAIVLRVDSPGGSALASDLIWNELAKSKKPVVASMSDVAASGGYYISMGARKIYAEPNTITGSIGVLGGKLALGGTFDKIGITTDVVSRGANAGVFSLTQPFSESEKKAVTALMQDVYDQFLDKALAGRKKAGKEMTRDQLVKLAGGRIWTGRQAKENGLIDEVGTLDDAIAAAKKLADLPEDKELELLILPKSKSFIDVLLESKSDASLMAGPEGRLLRELPELARKLRPAGALLQLRSEPVWVTMPYLIDVK